MSLGSPLAIDFDADKPCAGNRPLMDCELFGPLGSLNFTAFVDTGADYTTLPIQFAHQVGLPLPAAPGTTAITAAGVVPSHRATADLALHDPGATVAVEIDFGPSLLAFIGRLTLWTALDSVGFEQARWLFKS